MNRRQEFQLLAAANECREATLRVPPGFIQDLFEELHLHRAAGEEQAELRVKCYNMRLALRRLNKAHDALKRTVGLLAPALVVKKEKIRGSQTSEAAVAGADPVHH